MKKHEKILLFLHWFVGIGALFGGGAAILVPNGPLGISTEELKGGPFTNYLVPGIILFVMLGIGNVVCGLVFKRHYKAQGYMSSVVSYALMIWIAVQCFILKAVAPPHVLYFFIGVIQASLSMKLLWDNNQFPMNLILKILKK